MQQNQIRVLKDQLSDSNHGQHDLKRQLDHTIDQYKNTIAQLQLQLKNERNLVFYNVIRLSN
jgi:hypothetical protein